MGSTELGIVVGKLNSWSANLEADKGICLIKPVAMHGEDNPPVFHQLPPHYKSASHTPAQDYMWLRDKTKDQLHREPPVTRDVMPWSLR